MSILLYQTENGPVTSVEGRHHRVSSTGAGAMEWDALLNRADLAAHLRGLARADNAIDAPAALSAPIGSQEVWAAGVTYFRSRTARMEESKDAGGGTFYDRVYEADRPELFFKATAARVVAPGGRMRLRRDSSWMVPEPELVLAINNRKQIVGYTVGNDLSCRDIEGENPLYLPQAKVFDGCAALGPGLLISNEPPAKETTIAQEIVRAGKTVSSGKTRISELKRTLSGLVEYLTRELSFPAGCFLFTGTGIVPADDFTLVAGDEIRITIDGIGTLVNTVG